MDYFMLDSDSMARELGATVRAKQGLGSDHVVWQSGLNHDYKHTTARPGLPKILLRARLWPKH
jgi:hypothetical protein